jgi:hypothetical protein
MSCNQHVYAYFWKKNFPTSLYDNLTFVKKQIEKDLNTNFKDKIFFCWNVDGLLLAW